MKRILAFVLVFAMVLSLIPSVFATGEEEIIVYTEEDYVTADLMWEKVHAKEDEMQSKKATVKQTTEAIVAEITSSPYYEEGTLIRNGEHIFWETVDGIPCGYSPRLSQIGEDATPLEGYDVASAPTVLTSNPSKRGGFPNSRDVYLIQPYYGIDTAFTTQYVEEAERIAQGTGGSATILRNTSATIDTVADAIESGGVIIFDSHGDTDYANGEDYVSQANSSYLCLQTGTGLTSKDYDLATGPFGTYYHAFYGGSYKELRYYCIDGTAIANHMDQKAQNSILWMAICLSMATDGLQAPLRGKGVEVAYGYTRSVTFTYDYLWEEAFWEKMLLGETVSRAIAYMKEEVGDWDYCHSASYDTIEEAREKYCAFPIVVSSEDTYPGHGKVDDLQTVHSTYTVLIPCPHNSYTDVPYKAPTCTTDGNIAYYVCTDCGALFADSGLENLILQADTVIPATGHTYDSGEVVSPATCKIDGSTRYTCTVCHYSYVTTVPAFGHSYVSGLCEHCGLEQPLIAEFEPGVSGTYVIAAKVNGIYYALPNTYSNTSGKLIPIIVEAPYGYIEAEDAENVALELIYKPSNGKYLIYNGTYYLKYPSSTNLGGTESEYYWTLNTGVNGTWKFVSENSTRGLIYRASGYNYFGGYYVNNAYAGSKEYYDLELIPVAKLPCTHVMDEGVITTAPTCTAEGVKTYTCTLCQETTTEAVAPTGHRWNTGFVVTDPTCITVGVFKYTCLSCNATKTESIPATGEHTYENGVCTGCGDVLPTEPATEPTEPATEPTEPATEPTEPATEPTEAPYPGQPDDPNLPEGSHEPILDENVRFGHNLNLASDISINYAVRESDLKNYDSFYLICTIPEYEGTVQTSSEEVTIAPVYKSGVYYFTLTGITAVHMNNEIQSVLYMTKGEELYCSPADTYSVATYAYGQLADETKPDVLRKLCAELLRYGSTAQIFKGYRTDALADSQMTEAHKAYLSDLDTVVFNNINTTLDDFSSPSVKWVGKTLNLESKVGVKFIVDLSAYTGSPEELELRYSYVNYKGETVEGVVKQSEVYYEALNYYSFEVDSLLAAELRTPITATVYCGDTRLSATTIYSPDTYANGRTGNLLTLCKSLMSYSDTALSYFGV